MGKPIGGPESMSDAFLMYRAVDDTARSPWLNQRFGKEAVLAAQASTFAWVDYGLEGVPIGAERVVLASRKCERKLDPTDTGALPFEELEDASVPRVSGKDIEEIAARPLPHDFDSRESEVILAAIRSMALTRDDSPGGRREALHLLARRSPSVVERMLCRVAFTSTVTFMRQSRKVSESTSQQRRRLVQWVHARTA